MFKLTLKLRIYLSMVAIIAIAFIVTFGISIVNYNAQNTSFNEQNLYKKEEAVLNTILYYMVQHGEDLKSDSIAAFFSDKICELSDVHNVFIALFDLKGRYIISSGFDEMDSLNIPEQISYSVLKQLSTGNQRAVIDRDFKHEKYVLAYWYFSDYKGKPIGIANVAYEKSTQKQEELKDFLTELSKVYFILFFLAAGVAYLLSAYIARSLQTIAKKMREVRLGETNEPIVWESKDEIGDLVNEYNTMLTKLDDSVSKLSKSERESAWREMAQQVAHEIKNPLTPMRLRTQHLLKMWNEKPEDFGKKIELYTTGMIEQIDALSNIAGEFSNFAKMPKAILLPVNLVSLVEGVVELFKQDSTHVIRLRTYNITSEVLQLDKDQMIRALNNLITNAIQAFPPGTKGEIDIAVKGYKQQVIIRVQDNGLGISDEVKKKLFVPNFTTKSTGTGLGLSMVKNIMTQNKGSVECWSREGHGTSFFLFLRIE